MKLSLLIGVALSLLIPASALSPPTFEPVDPRPPIPRPSNLPRCGGSWVRPALQWQNDSHFEIKGSCLSYRLSLLWGICKDLWSVSRYSYTKIIPILIHVTVASRIKILAPSSATVLMHTIQHIRNDHLRWSTSINMKESYTICTFLYE